MADVSADVSLSEIGERGEASQMRRVIDWKHGFYIATGVPALVLVSIGFIATIVGPPSVLVWVLSVVIGMLMSFVFAEIASMFPEKTGGIPIFAAVAYRKYTLLVGPVVTWGYWFAWSPVLAINGLLVGGYVNALAIHSTNAWINWLIGAVVLVAFFAINHYGIKQGAYAQLVLGICAIVPLLLLGIVPWFHGQVDFARFSPFAPLGGGWGSFQGWVNFFGALFVAGWSAYAFETAVSYCAEFRNPKADAPRAILTSGLLSLVCFSLVPLALIGALGMKAIVQDPSVALVPLAKEVFGGAGGQIIIVLLIVALLLSTNTAMMGSSRALYQMSRDGNTFRFMGRLNRYGIPDRAMMFDVLFNLALMAFAVWASNGTVGVGASVFVLAASTVGYMTALALVLFGAYLLRRDHPNAERPYRAPRGFIGLGLFLAVLNILFMVAGWWVWGWQSIVIGALIVLASIPIYYYRKLVEDRRVAPAVGEARLS
jgi:amino acid transporter